jgi:hypothetical protein
MGGKSVARSRNVFAAAARAEKLQQAAHPEELGFDVTRLERMTEPSRVTSMPASFPVQLS